jgi:hypothetical protein
MLKASFNMRVCVEQNIFYFGISILVWRLHLLFAHTLFIQFELEEISIRAASAQSPLSLPPVLGSSFAASIYLLTMRRINFHCDACRNLNYLHHRLLKIYQYFNLQAYPTPTTAQRVMHQT